MKLIQLNIWQGRLLGQALKFLEREQPDFVCLQEVYSAPSRPDLFDVFRHFGTLEAIKAALPNYDCYFSPTYDVRVLGETVRYGNAILSKFPLRDQETFFISGEHKTIETFQQINVRNLQRVRVEFDENRSFSLINHQGFWDANPLGNEQSVEKMRHVAGIVGETERPIIFCGDLNISPASPALRVFDKLKLRNLTVERGVTTTLSSVHRAGVGVVCDYIFSSPEIAVRDFGVSEELISDHKAMGIEFDVLPLTHERADQQSYQDEADYNPSPEVGERDSVPV